MTGSVQISRPPVSAGPEPSGWRRIRVALALDGAAVGFALILFDVLPVTYAMPLIGLMLAGTLFGAAGVALAAPLTATIRILVLRLYVEDVLERPR